MALSYENCREQADTAMRRALDADSASDAQMLLLHAQKLLLDAEQLELSKRYRFAHRAISAASH